MDGAVERLSSEESREYFKLRARGSKIGAWASEQTTVLQDAGDGRQALEERVRTFDDLFKDTADDDIDVPEFWGGLRIVPRAVEFWQGRESRLHDRFRYTRVESAAKGDCTQEWSIERLSP